MGRPLGLLLTNKATSCCSLVHICILSFGSSAMHAKGVAAAEEDKRNQLLPPWTHIPMPGAVIQWLLSLQLAARRPVAVHGLGPAGPCCTAREAGSLSAASCLPAVWTELSRACMCQASPSSGSTADSRALLAGIFVGLASQGPAASASEADEAAQASAGAQPGELNPAWKRKAYPAGRILHLVPARLVPGALNSTASVAVRLTGHSHCCLDGASHLTDTFSCLHMQPVHRLAARLRKPGLARWVSVC